MFGNTGGGNAWKCVINVRASSYMVLRGINMRDCSIVKETDFFLNRIHLVYSNTELRHRWAEEAGAKGDEADIGGEGPGSGRVEDGVSELEAMDG